MPQPLLFYTFSGSKHSRYMVPREVKISIFSIVLKAFRNNISKIRKLFELYNLFKTLET